MEFSTLYPKQLNSHYLTLVSIKDTEATQKYANNSNIIFLNPKFILSIKHIKTALNKTYYNLSVKKYKSKDLKKEFLYLLGDCKKIDDGEKMYNASGLTVCYLLLLNYKENNLNTKKILNDLKATEISVGLYSNYSDFEGIIQHFKIDFNKEINGLENALERAVLNRIAVKDLK